MTLLLTLEDNIVNGSASRASDPASKAAKVAGEGISRVPTVFEDISTYWLQYWAKSGLRLPQQPAIEAYWYGANFILACAASERNDVAPPGLYGPWVTSDNPSWHGDYTLDYNQEATM
jgi:hypothetical protein